jgi:Na+/proline symporter
METLILTLAIFSVLVGLVGLVWSIRELVMYEHYVLPKRKRRATYIKPKR